MAGRLFGTDGIRGRTNTPPMDAQTALLVGMAAGHRFTRGDHRHRVVIGKDTRLSGYMLEPALTAGFTAVGMDVFLFGPLPTPAVAMMVRSLRADLGVMLSASHNSYEDNGIKLFGPDGYKLSDDAEAAIEALVAKGAIDGLPAPAQLGRAKRVDDAQARYIEFAKGTFPRQLSLEGLKIVIDCAHGAAYKVAPAVLWELGADVIPLGDEPDGFNINGDCGSTSPQLMCETVRQTGADLGIALDGDADRVILADNTGKIINGDQIMALITLAMKQEDRLDGPGLVATVMSNLGLELFLASHGLKLIRTKVGDRHVIEHMRANGFNVGGEQSGHIILGDYATTGDGLIAALQVLACLITKGRPANEVCHLFDPLPQVLKNVRVPRMGAEPIEAHRVQTAIRAAEIRLGADGRILVRPSGTEPLIRVMGEGPDEKVVREVVDAIAAEIEAAA
ncbi:MAG: phosphoglucosamine mutase [Alphaproteobacteria bacterium]